MEHMFETKLYNKFVLPGAIAESLILLSLIMPEVLSLLGIRLFLPISGPTGVAVGMTLLPLQILFYTFIFISAVYAFLLIWRYKKQSPKFVATARDFLLLGDITIGLMMIPSICFTIVGWDFVIVPVVLAVLLLGSVALWFFVYWTTKVYRYENLHFWSKATLISVGKAVGLILVGFFVFILIFNLMFLFY